MPDLFVNGQRHSLPDIDPQMPLLWALRDHLGLVGTKYGCGIGDCGACNVLLNGEPIRACLVTVSMVAEGEVTTIEGIAARDGTLHPLQQVWIDDDVAQCGYCQPGQLISAVALLHRNPDPTDADIDNAMSGNLCRCGTYNRIRAAIRKAAGAGGVQSWQPGNSSGAPS